jgi:hypothetical protein
MKNETEQNIIHEKPSWRKYTLSAVFFALLISADLIFIYFTQEQGLDSTSDKIIREVAARQLNKDPNDLTDEDFVKITTFYLSDKELCDIKLLEKFTNLERLYLAAIQFPRDRIPKWMKLLEKTGIVNTNERFTIDLTPLEKLT